MRSTTVALPQILSDAPSESEAAKNAWYGFLAAHLDYFENLASYLVADSMLVEYVMIRAVDRLGNTPFDAFDPQQNYTRARRALIGEAVTLLDISSRKSG
jgi:hypothetical protein